MNEPIMRRGLSPEGRRIRSRHQGSLLNDEFGVTSQPIHKKIEKDFLKENIMRLKEIQAKCRTQESRPISGHQPVKAIRSNVAALPLAYMKDGIPNTQLEEALNLKLREGSAHSDYFSLPDDSQHDSSSSSHPPSLVTRMEGSQERTPPTDFVSRVSEKHFADDSVGCESGPCSYRSHSCRNPSPPSKPSSPDTTPSPNLSSKFRDFYPHALRRSKISNIIEKIKSKKPACDTSTSLVWRDIEKQHKAFFADGVTTTLTTPRTPNNIFSTNINTPHPHPNLEKTQSTLARSQSLDRGSLYRANLKSIPLKNATYTLHPRPKSSSMNLISLEQNLEVGQPPPTGSREKEEPSSPSLSQTESLPSLNAGGRGSMASLNEACSSAEGATFHFKDRPDADVDAQDRGTPDADKGESGSKGLDVVPIITKRDSSMQTSKQPIQAQQRANFLRSKSSSNLRLTGQPPPTYKRGQIPRYLKSRKAETQRRVEAAAAVDPLCPPGHTPLPDPERRNTLHLLKKGQADMMRQLSALPVAQDTLRVRQLKQDLEAKLTQIEEGIGIFSQPKVYVINED